MEENENFNILNQQSQISNSIINEYTIFNKLQGLQKLVKKESAIKELFIKTKEETKNSIERQCVDIYKKKMEVLDILQKIDKTKINSQKMLKEYILVEDNYQYLSNVRTYISNILKYLWDEPKLLSKIIIKADKEDVKEYLAPLICNNFYENILSPNYIEDPLIYIIYLLLKKEINSMKDIDQGFEKFLEGTRCSYLLQQLIEKNDVKEFFKLILNNTLEEISADEFTFNVDELNIWQRERGKTVSKSVFDKNYLTSQNVDNRGKRISHNNFQENDLTKVQTLSKIEIQGITEDDKETIKNNINYQVFTAVYLTRVSLEELQENINKYKDDIYLKSYYENLLLKANGDKEAYSQNSFIDDITNTNDSESILVFYQQNFLKVKEFLNKFFQNIISNYRIIPYAIKCVSKIIYQLISNKFKDANELKKNLFVSKFFYKTLVFPIFQKPDINALINDYIISKNTVNNLSIISKILWTLVSFELYKDNSNNKDDFGIGNFTPFNRLFLEKIPEVFKINKMIIDVNLPHFIEGLINQTINEDEYYFDFFNENPNEISFYQSILLNIKEFNSLFLNLVKFKKKLLKPKTTKKKEGEKEQKEQNEQKEQKNIEPKYLELKNKSEKNKKNILTALNKIKSADNFKLYQEIVEKVDYSVITETAKSKNPFSKKKVTEIKKEKVKYFHVSQLLFSEKSKKLFSLEQKNFYYHIKELKEKDFKNISQKELIIQNNIIKCKNFLSSILYNYRILDKNDFNKDKTNNIIDILKELAYFMKSSNFLIDGKIPSEWYLFSLIECLKKLPDDYKKDEYQKLFDELTIELNESINKCNFEYMSLFLDEMKFGNRNKVFNEKVKEIYIDIELNNKANDIIENYKINVILNSNFNEDKLEFSIFKENLKEKQLDFLNSFTFNDSQKAKTCETLEKLVKKFPNLNLCNYKNVKSGEKLSVFELQKILDMPKKLDALFHDIKEILQNIVKNENELNIINDKIYDYVFSRIYDKIYPKDREDMDSKILQKACKLTWIEPENIIKDKVQYDFDFVLPDINNYFNQIRNEKSPRKKIINLNNIYLSINRLLKFTKGDVPIGVDDQIPLLTYYFIKSRPWGIFTDMNFMKLYIGNKKNKNEDNQLSQLFSICDFIEHSEFNSFYNVNKNEYEEKSKNSFKEAFEYMNQFDINL